ncbi:hypothetical protein ACJMK2_008447 [Sinanodonta woodiana]|uniref:Amidohydrolase-related domain-containing protein n=1 Tax=Sinanodonta woodiana TaxID=1069815 RepID=A0ABD3VME9_SINWO
MEQVDLVIRNGTIIDPKNEINGAICDVAVKNSKIYSIGKGLLVTAVKEIDAAGCLVTPGLIDNHVHCYEYATPLGINPDRDCLARGVTTAVDCGSAGASTFMGLRKYVVEKSSTRVLCLLHIASHGLAAAGCAGGCPGGESDTLAFLDIDACKGCIEKNRDVIKGVKIRLQKSVCAKGATEDEAYRRALIVSEACAVPLMVHHIESSVPTQRPDGADTRIGCPSHLRAGDFYTHAFHGYDETIINSANGKVHDDVISARKRGVLFDVGHGMGSFNWKVAEIGAKQGFWPDIISSDLHTQNIRGPVYDLLTVMTKFLHLGMPLYEVIKSTTLTPARALGMETEIGSLTAGCDADITIIKQEACDVQLEDSVTQLRNVKQRLVPVHVFRSGVQHPILPKLPWPNEDILQHLAFQLERCVIKDDA